MRGFVVVDFCSNQSIFMPLRFLYLKHVSVGKKSSLILENGYIDESGCSHDI